MTRIGHWVVPQINSPSVPGKPWEITTFETAWATNSIQGFKAWLETTDYDALAISDGLNALELFDKERKEGGSPTTFLALFTTLLVAVYDIRKIPWSNPIPFALTYSLKRSAISAE